MLIEHVLNLTFLQQERSVNLCNNGKYIFYNDNTV